MHVQKDNTMPLTPDLKKKIFRRAIRYKNGDRVVRVRPQDLVDVLGHAESRNLIPGFDLEEILTAEKDAIRKQILQLRHEEAELKELAEAGIAEAKRDLKLIRIEILNIFSGKLRGYAVVPIPVDALRSCVGGEQEPAPQLSAEDEERFEKMLEENKAKQEQDKEQVATAAKS